MSEIKLWKDRENKSIEPTLFSEKAEELAKEFAKDNQRSRKVNKRTQIRKFYDEVLRLDNESQSRPEQWDNILPRLHMLIAKAAYARGRELVSDNYLSFIKTSIGQVFNPEDLKVFANFFEAFMGFYRLHGPRD